MKFSMNKSIVFVIFIIAHALSAAAADIQVRVEKAKSSGKFSVGIGSNVILQTKDSEISGRAVFLGKALAPDGTPTFQIYLSEKDQQVHYIDAKHFDLKNSEMQTVLNPYEQAGGTCTGYAIYGFLQQTKLSGFTGTGILNDKLSSERGRTTLLVDNVNEYYLTPQHRYSIQGILNKYGREFGFSCNTYKYQTFEKLRDRILNQLTVGKPVMVSFNLGPNMYHTPFALDMYDAKAFKMDDRLWIPRKIGERNGGGHTIVLAGAFEFQNKTYLVTIDSDWSEPRIWDIDSFLNDKTAIEEVEVTTCKE